MQKTTQINAGLQPGMTEDETENEFGEENSDEWGLDEFLRIAH